jgi:hypothetical protein
VFTLIFLLTFSNLSNNVLLMFSEALSKLNNVIRHPDARLPDNIMAYDNAVSALGKICQFHRDGIDAAQVSASFPYDVANIF